MKEKELKRSSALKEDRRLFSLKNIEFLWTFEFGKNQKLGVLKGSRLVIPCQTFRGHFLIIFATRALLVRFLLIQLYTGIFLVGPGVLSWPTTAPPLFQTLQILDILALAILMRTCEMMSGWDISRIMSTWCIRTKIGRHWTPLKKMWEFGHEKFKVNCLQAICTVLSAFSPG